MLALAVAASTSCFGDDSDNNVQVLKESKMLGVQGVFFDATARPVVAVDVADQLVALAKLGAKRVQVSRGPYRTAFKPRPNARVQDCFTGDDVDELVTEYEHGATITARAVVPQRRLALSRGRPRPRSTSKG